jgi:hypothetical protein
MPFPGGKYEQFFVSSCPETPFQEG